MIGTILKDHALASRRSWATDRSQTVGASEVGLCARRVAFSKAEADPMMAIARDGEFEDAWGAQVRGNVFEDAFFVPALRTRFGEDVLFAGDRQQTFVSGFLSATPDALVINQPRDALAPIGALDIESDCFVVDCKTADPRMTLAEAKPENVFQIHAQIGLMREVTNHRPVWGVLPYTNASFWDVVTEFAVRFDPMIYAEAKTRARAIMTAEHPTDLKPEGVIAGGKECERCPFTRACGQDRFDRVPDKERPVDNGVLQEMKDIARLIRVARANEDEASQEKRDLEQRMRDLMAASETKKVPGVATWSAIKGRLGWDNDAIRHAAEAAGVDLAPYRRTGDPSDRLTITLKD